jgi:hypothetical protein
MILDIIGNPFRCNNIQRGCSETERYSRTRLDIFATCVCRIECTAGLLFEEVQAVAISFFFPF